MFILSLHPLARAWLELLDAFHQSKKFFRRHLSECTQARASDLASRRAVLSFQAALLQRWQQCAIRFGEGKCRADRPLALSRQQSRVRFGAILPLPRAEKLSKISSASRLDSCSEEVFPVALTVPAYVFRCIAAFFSESRLMTRLDDTGAAYVARRLVEISRELATIEFDCLHRGLTAAGQAFCDTLLRDTPDAEKLPVSCTE